MWLITQFSIAIVLWLTEDNHIQKNKSKILICLVLSFWEKHVFTLPFLLFHILEMHYKHVFTFIIF